MAQYIDKDALVAEIERRLEEYRTYPDYQIDSNYMELCDILSFLNTLEVKEVDLEKEARHYLLHEHSSPLTEIMHQANLNAEMQYHKDIEKAFKRGFELRLKAKGE